MKKSNKLIELKEPSESSVREKEERTNRGSDTKTEAKPNPNRTIPKNQTVRYQTPDY